MIRLMLIPLLMLAVGCSASVNVKRLSQVKSAAIIGFSVDDQDGVSDESNPFGAAQASQAYEALRQQLSAGTGWTITPQADVVANPVYQKTVKDESGAMSALRKLVGDDARRHLANPRQPPRFD